MLINPNSQNKASDTLSLKRNKQGFYETDMHIPDLLEWVDNTSNEIYSIWSDVGKLIYVSTSIEQLLGYQAKDLNGVSWDRFLGNEQIDIIRRYVDLQSVDKQSFNVRLRHKNDRYIWCECTSLKVFSTEENQILFTCTIRDITDKKEIEEMMIQSEKMSIAGQLAAGVAHEIRNPLTAIKGFLQLLEAGVAHKEEYYKIMIDEVEKMETITSEMLFISKPVTDHQQDESITEMINDVIILLRTQAKVKNINILFESKHDSYLYCDRSQIKQVLINLIKNAIEAMDEPGTITIKHISKESNIIIDVSDEGVGISEEIIHKLNEPFFTTKQSGTGLGLMVTNQILKRHNAAMNIIQNKDKGSTFRLIFNK